MRQKLNLNYGKMGGAAHDATKVIVNTAVGHYNATLNRCLIRSQMTTQAPDGMTMWFISVKDAFDGKEFASEINPTCASERLYEGQRYPRVPLHKFRRNRYLLH